MIQLLTRNDQNQCLISVGNYAMGMKGTKHF